MLDEKKVELSVPKSLKAALLLRIRACEKRAAKAAQSLGRNQ